MRINLILAKILRVHDAIRDLVWAFATKENLPAEKLFSHLPLTEKTKFIHAIDDKYTNFKNKFQKFERKFLALLFWLFVATMAMYFVWMIFSFIFRNFRG